MSQAVADVAIIGAGIIGSGIASALSRQGKEVVLVDPAPGLGSSLGNAGLVVPSYATPMSTPGNLWEGIRHFGSDQAPVGFAHPLGLLNMQWLARFALQCRSGRVTRDTAKLHAMATRSLRRYGQLRDEGLDLGMAEQGWLWLSGNSNPASLHANAERMRQAGAVCQVVGRAEAEELQPGLGDSVSGGIWFPNEAYLDPARAAGIWLDDALEHGAALVREKVVAVDTGTSGIKSVRTTGQTVAARQFVLATGADSRHVGKLFGVAIPIESGYGWSLTLRDPETSVDRALMGIEDHVVISPLPGRVRITGGMRFGGTPGAPKDADIRTLRENAGKVLPGLNGLEEESRWQGARPMTASGVPIIERARQSNLVIAAGHGPLGVTLAPDTVDRVVQLLAGAGADSLVG